MFDRFRSPRGDTAGKRDEAGGAVSAEELSATSTKERDAGLRNRDERIAERERGVAADERPAATTADERRFARDEGVGAPATEATRVHDRDRDGVDDRDRTTVADGPVRERRSLRDLDGDGVDDRVERREPMADRVATPVVGRDTMAAVRERQRERFGGFSWGSDFFGFLCALGLASILTGILAATGVALGLFQQATGSGASTTDAQTIGLGGAIALLVVLAIAWYAGGYVAGRMARFDGARQGVGVWLWTVLFIAVIAALAAIGGSKYNVLDSLNLPSVPAGGDTLTQAGAITAGAALLTMLIFAVVGGKVGERFHRRVDRLAHDEEYIAATAR